MLDRVTGNFQTISGSKGHKVANIVPQIQDIINKSVNQSINQLINGDLSLSISSQRRKSQKLVKNYIWPGIFPKISRISELLIRGCYFFFQKIETTCFTTLKGKVKCFVCVKQEGDVIPSFTFAILYYNWNHKRYYQSKWEKFQKCH